jgi:hypothetical protein
MEDRVFLSGSASRGSSLLGLPGYGVTGSPESPLESPVFGSSHRPQRIGSPGFRVSPHEPPDPLFSTSFSLSLSISLSHFPSLWVARAEEQRRRMKKKEEREKKNMQWACSRSCAGEEEKKKEKRKRK